MVIIYSSSSSSSSSSSKISINDKQTNRFSKFAKNQTLFKNQTKQTKNELFDLIPDWKKLAIFDNDDNDPASRPASQADFRKHFFHFRKHFSDIMMIVIITMIIISR